MIIIISNAGIRRNVSVPDNADLGYVRSLTDELDEVGAPTSFTLAVNATGRNDDWKLAPGDEVTFRPVQGDKGA